VLEAYFDESGDLADKRGIFCISGYVLESDAAEVMDQEWERVLEHHNLPYFHMVDCAHGNEEFKGKAKAERVEIETKLIGLIKKYTIRGYSVIGNARHFPEPTEDNPDVYTHCALWAADFVDVLLQGIRQVGADVSCFFEAGHKSRGRAYPLVAERLAKFGAKVAFRRKEELRLLQAADLLAWQTTKFVGDAATQSRKPRGDFRSLMQHHHMFTYLSYDSEFTKTAISQFWPEEIHRNVSVFAGLKPFQTEPIVMLRNGSDPMPFIWVAEPDGWMKVGPDMYAFRFQDLQFKHFALLVDEKRLPGTLGMFSASAKVLNLSLLAEGATVEKVGDGVIVNVQLPTGESLKIEFPNDKIGQLANALAPFANAPQPDAAPRPENAQPSADPP
jgi:hypothetical protein